MIALVLALAAVSGCGGGGGEPAAETGAMEEVTELGTEVADFCAAARANAEAARSLADFVAAGEPPRSADEVAAVTGPLRASNEDLLAKAPDELRADAEAAAQLAELQLGVFEATGGDAAAAEADPAYLAKAAEVGDATGRLRQFLRATCRLGAS